MKCFSRLSSSIWTDVILYGRRYNLSRFENSIFLNCSNMINRITKRGLSYPFDRNCNVGCLIHSKEFVTFIVFNEPGLNTRNIYLT